MEVGVGWGGGEGEVWGGGGELSTYRTLSSPEGRCVTRRLLNTRNATLLSLLKAALTSCSSWISFRRSSDATVKQRALSLPPR